MRPLLTLLVALVAGMSSLTSAQNVLASHEFEARDVTSVTLKGVFCDISVQQGETFHFKGRIEGRGDEGDYTIDSRLDGDEVDIWVDSRSNWGWGNRISSSRLELTVPKGMEVRVENTSGDIFIRDVDNRALRASSTSGDIEVSKVVGPTRVTCTSGDVELDDITGDLEVRTTSGDVEVDGVRGDIELGSTSGDVELMDFEGDLWAHTTSGGIDIKNGRGAMRFKTTSGDIDGYGLEITGDMEVRASSGDIDLELTNDLQELNFDLESSSGNLRVGRRSGEDELYLKNGNGYWVKGVTSSGSIDFSN